MQVFTSNGDCVALLRVPHVSGGCFIGAHGPPLLLLAVGVSVSVYEMTGRLVKEIPLTGRQQDAPVLTTVAYGDGGFVAVRSRSLSICRGGISRPAVVRTLAGRYRLDRGTTPFVNVVDVQVDPINADRRICFFILSDCRLTRCTGVKIEKSQCCSTRDAVNFLQGVSTAACYADALS